MVRVETASPRPLHFVILLFLKRVLTSSLFGGVPLSPLLLRGLTPTCLLYTSDAADEGLGVDLGGRRIIKKKELTVSAPRYVPMSLLH